MKIVLNIIYDQTKDQNAEASKRDRFIQKLYGQGKWSRSESGGLEISL